jgi:nucleoside-diphosphate-sugar epimerase
MKVFITGVSGLVGHGIAKFFIENGHKVIGTSFKKKILTNNKNYKILNNFDISSSSSIKVFEKICKKEKISAVINCAAKLPLFEKKRLSYNIQDYIDVNYISVIKLISVSKQNNIKHFINISGCATNFYKAGINNEYECYLLSKKTTDLFIDTEINKKKFFYLSTIKISAPYGYIFNRNTIFVKFIKNAIKNKPLTIFGNGNRGQVFTFTEDVGKCCLKIIFKKLSGTFYCMGNESIKTKQLAEKIIKTFHSKSVLKILNKFNEKNTNNVQLLRKIKNFNIRPTNLNQALSKILIFLKKKKNLKF